MRQSCLGGFNNRLPRQHLQGEERQRTAAVVRQGQEPRLDFHPAFPIEELGRHDNVLKRGKTLECIVVVGPAKVGLGFHPPSTACRSIAVVPMLHRHQNLRRRVGTAVAPAPPAGQPPHAANTVSASADRRPCLLAVSWPTRAYMRRPRLLTPCRPPSLPAAPSRAIPASGHASSHRAGLRCRRLRLLTRVEPASRCHTRSSVGRAGQSLLAPSTKPATAAQTSYRHCCRLHPAVAGLFLPTSTSHLHRCRRTGLPLPGADGGIR